MAEQKVIPPFSLSPKRQDDRQESFGFGDSKPIVPPKPAPPPAPPPPSPPPVIEPPSAAKPAPRPVERKPRAAAPSVPDAPVSAPPAAAPMGRVVLAVSEAVSRAARLLEDHFGEVWIEGEIEGLKRHQVSGNCYFALKDGAARIDATMWRAQAAQVRFPLREGMKVRARGRMTIYKEQGRFQIRVEELELSGEGELLRQFEELKARLQREGLFDSARKRPLPAFPKVIGVATSQSGAALFDILRVASRRGRVQFLVANCAVQGQQAPAQIVQAIERLGPLVDVMIVGRGGGSVTDLWSFNDEEVARAIFRSPVPVVSAVGHEVDFTIADFVADLRAPTPSAAAELCVPDFRALFAECDHLTQRLLRAGRRVLEGARQALDGELGRAENVLTRSITQRRRLLTQLNERLSAQHPHARVLRDRAALTETDQRLHAAIRRQLDVRQRGIEGLAGKLDALSPLKVLTRGYAVARTPEGAVLTRAADAAPGDAIDLLLSEGGLRCRVESPLGEAPPKPKPRAKAKPKA